MCHVERRVLTDALEDDGAKLVEERGVSLGVGEAVLCGDLSGDCRGRTDQLKVMKGCSENGDPPKAQSKMASRVASVHSSFSAQGNCNRESVSQSLSNRSSMLTFPIMLTMLRKARSGGLSLYGTSCEKESEVSFGDEERRA